MGKIAFLFSGQGAQYVGMGKELYENYEVCHGVFDEASESLGFDVKELCFEGPIETLNQTEYTQPAVVTVSLAAYAVFRELGIRPMVGAGFSLGEYSALTAAGVFDLKTVIPLVRKRGKYMQEAVPLGKGKMVAILGLNAEKVDEACEFGKSLGVVSGANYNCPGQIVIGGEVAAVDAAAQKALELGAMKALALPVSAPFHTSLLEPAADKLSVDLNKVLINKPDYPLISNVTAKYYKEDQIKDLLKLQVKSPVLWERSIRRMIADGVDTFIEFGPGKTLSGFVRKVDRKLTVCNIEDIASLEKTKKTLGL